MRKCIAWIALGLTVVTTRAGAQGVDAQRSSDVDQAENRLVGASRYAPHSQIYVVLGINLGNTSKAKESSSPVSSRQR